MNVTRVWNISDHPATKVVSRMITIFGQPCAPGRYVLVNDEQLKDAHKLDQDVAAKMLYVGDQPPADYVAAKATPRAPFPKGASRAHGQAPLAAVSDAAPAFVEHTFAEGDSEGSRNKRRRG
jgi:hypothetical protein